MCYFGTHTKECLPMIFFRCDKQLSQPEFWNFQNEAQLESKRPFIIFLKDREDGGGVKGLIL